MNTDGMLTVRFKTNNGNPYLYDVKSNRVFPCPDPVNEIINCYCKMPKDEIIVSLSSKYPEDQLQDWYNQVNRWIRIDRAFLHVGEDVKAKAILEKAEDISEEEYWDTLLSAEAIQLILVITDNCNLRCRYCIYGEHYEDFPKYANNKMSFETAIKAIDYYLYQLRNPQKIRYLPRKGVNFIGFYGGEPLLEFGLIKRCIDYVQAKLEFASIDFRFNLTTNATLLTDEIIEYFIKNRVALAVSLDGPREEHDRNRVYANGVGTYDTVIRNLKRIQEWDPEYYNENVMLVMTYDYKTDLDRLNEFLIQNGDTLPIAARLNAVVPTNSTYYHRFSEEVRQSFQDKIRKYRRLFFKDMIKGGMVNRNGGIDVESLLCRNFVFMLANRYYGYAPESSRRYTATCTPGMKCAVRPDGSFHICERMSPHFPIGDCESGICFDKVRNLMHDYYEQIIKAKCSQCIAQRMCNVCFAVAQSNGRFDFQNTCESIRAALPENLSFCYSILEENPQAFKQIKGYSASVFDDCNVLWNLEIQ